MGTHRPVASPGRYWEVCWALFPYSALEGEDPLVDNSTFPQNTASARMLLNCLSMPSSFSWPSIWCIASRSKSSSSFYEAGVLVLPSHVQANAFPCEVLVRVFGRSAAQLAIEYQLAPRAETHSCRWRS